MDYFKESFYVNKPDPVLQDHGMQNEESLLWSSFKSGSRASLDIIFEKYVGLLYSYGKRLTKDEELVADCIQDVFFELWVKRESLTHRIHSVKYYLFRCVRTRILRRLSVDMRLQGTPITDDYCEEMEFNIEHSLIMKETLHDLSDQLKNSVKTLSKAQQEAIYLKFYENMTYEEIANVMNTDVKAVYNLVGRSIISLRKLFRSQPMVTE